MAENVGGIYYSVDADTSGLLRAERDVDRSTDRMERSFDDSTKATQRQERAYRNLNPVTRAVRQETERLSRQNNQLGQTAGIARNAIQGLIGALSVREVIRYADAWQNAENQLRQVTDSTEQLTAVQKALVNVARDTRSNFESTANLYARLARSTTDLGLSQEDLIGLTTTINQSFATSGATAEEASAAITQLSQGLASGALRGDEFNSVAEQAPDIMRAIAASLDLTIGELREFAATGGITAEIVVNALQGASDEIGGRFANSVATFGQQLEVARTNLIEWVGSSEEVREAVRTLGSSIVTLSENMDAIVAIGKAVAALYGGRLAAQLLIGAGAMLKTATAAASAARGVGLITLAVKALTSATGLGLLIGAGGLLFAFRDELGLTTEKAGLTEDQIADLRTELRGMSDDDLSGSLDDLNAELDEATLKASAAREELAKLRSENRGSGVLGFEGGSVGAEIAGMQALSDAENKLLEIEQRRNTANRETIRRWTERNQAQDESTESTDENTESTEENSAATRRAAEAADQRQRALQALTDQLYPLNAAQREYNEQSAMIDEAVEAGLINDKADAQNRLAEAYRNTVQSLGGFDDAMAAYPSIFEPRGEQQDQGEQQDPFEKWLSSAESAFSDFDALNANLAENFTSSFGNMFADVLTQQTSFKDGFQSLMQGLTRSVVAGIGEMIAQWLAYKAVTASLGFFGGGGFGGLLGGFAGLFDKGGRIPGGQWGIAGENGPEIINGPANITSTADTARIIGRSANDYNPSRSQRAMSGQAASNAPQTSVYVNVHNAPQGTEVVERQTDGRQFIDVFIADVTGNGRSAKALQSTFGLQRQGR
ncbi:MAG: hypothetical protein CMH22_15970 [Methylophaga sp.]|nr:hypothetical protein [Methylophaga sp.]MAX53473.1 hypothetical protein [Methylophaga sp.]|tara:strand:- start:11319 stop:13823 length:2505 start_codon:yes stop_codon:yes gene_type:complete